MIRGTAVDVTFRHAFALKGLESTVSFLAYRRLAIFIRVPVAGRSGSIQSVLVGYCAAPARAGTLNVGAFVDPNEPPGSFNPFVKPSPHADAESADTGEKCAG
jgi:hypothetical protein